MRKSVEEKADEVRQLQKQLADVSHVNHTEIVKLRLEVSEETKCYDAGGAKNGKS